MRLGLSRLRLAATALPIVVAACSGAATTTQEPTVVIMMETTTTTTPTGFTSAPASTIVAAPPVSTTTTVLATTVPATTVPTTTVPVAAPSTAVPAGPPVACQPPGEYVSTASGRRVLLRADGLAGPAPTIVVVHGYSGTPTGIERFAELTAAANERGVAVAYPEGTPTDDGDLGWNTGASVFATTAGDDLIALGEMIGAVVATGCVDPARVILAGESNGGGLALVAACTPTLATRLQRVVLVNAAVADGVLARCAGVGGVAPLTVVAGARDETVPTDGTAELLPLADWFPRAAAVVAGCQAVEPSAPFDVVVTRQVGAGCAVCTELLLIADGTHTWPGSSRGVNGLVPGTLDLNGLLIEAALAPPTPTPVCLTGRT